METHTYAAFGLILRSELPLPSLTSARAESPDLDIRLGAVATEGLPGGTAISGFAQALPGRVWLHIPGIARFLVSDGSLITVDPEAGADEQSIGIYLLGSCIGAIMHQRGRLILHGSALRFGDRCVIFAGRSGAGKSTLTAALHLRGHDLLADDLSVVDPQGRIQPGIPHIKLWADAAGMLGLDTGRMARIRMQVEKFSFRVAERFCDRPLPLAALYILHTHNLPEPLFEPVYGMAKLNPIKNNTYRLQHLQGLGMQARHLHLCGQLANRIRVVRVARPLAGSSLDELAARIEADMHAEAQPALETA